MPRRLSSLICMFGFCLNLSAGVSPADDMKSIVLLAGKPSHGYGAHEHLAGCRILAEAIERSTTNVSCQVIAGGWPEDETVLDNADSIVMYCDGGGGHPVLQHMDALEKQMQRGAGFVCLHYAVEVPKERAGEQFLNWLGGYFETHWSVNPHWTAEFESLPEHPVTRGVKPFSANDEWYFHMRFVEQLRGVTPILSAVPPLDTMRRADGPHSGNPAVRKAVQQREPQHVAWVFQRPNGGRSFGFTGGHYHWNWGREDIIKLVANAIVWTAGEDIPTAGLPLSRPTVEQLESGQDEPVPEKHDKQEIQEQFQISQTQSSSAKGTSASPAAVERDNRLVAIVNQEKSDTPPAATDDPRDPSNAIRGLRVHEELEVTLTASEPDLLSLTNLDIDHRGRIWVCEVVNYRRHNGERPEGDRILILEDTDGDGIAESSKVYYQGRDIDSAMGICVLGNQVIVSASPHVWIFTDEDGDDVPDRKEQFFSNTGQPQHDHSAHSFLFGPDGKLYWNFGNTGKSVHDAQGNLVVDRAGNPVVDRGKPYWGGMVFRCNPDGSEFEVLGHNFRNNYEITVDSFGALWQSDNDDDGNRATRINFVMEFGNYGYLDEMTGAGWREWRINLEETVPQQHWHLNDPGVVPTMLLTGAGSPTGITVYEGDRLPAIFQNEVLHCDAGPNVVRAYPTRDDGAGYSATIENMLVGDPDQWFRPADVCVAPDGSLFVTDWYDPGVGGHHMGDTERGRLFRLAAPGSKYEVPQFDFSTPEGAVSALRNPNFATRFMAWKALEELGESASSALEQMAIDDNPRMRARALWALGKLSPKGKLAVATALSDSDANVRMMGVRLARQLGIPPEQYFPKVINDPSPQVRRELAIALRFDSSPEMPQLWTVLAEQHDGSDRWYLEALGIGAGLRWSECFEHFMHQRAEKLDSAAVRDIVWRARAPEAADYVVSILLGPATERAEALRMLRALDFHPQELRSKSLQRVASHMLENPDGEHSDWLLTEALMLQNDPDRRLDAPMEAAVVRHLNSITDDERRLRILQAFELSDSQDRLVKLLVKPEFDSRNVTAANVLLRREGHDRLRELLRSDDPQTAAQVARSLARSPSPRARRLLQKALEDDAICDEARVEVAKGLAAGDDESVRIVLEAAKSGELPRGARFVVGSLLRNNRDAEIRKTAQELFPPISVRMQEPLPPLEELLKRQGDEEKGRLVFQKQGTCANCHVLDNQGKNVGPDLSEIGDKLSREALFVSILDPSAGISHNYESYAALTDSGQVVVGLLLSQTEELVVIKDAQGIEHRLETDVIESLKKQEVSLMPESLIEALSSQDLIDLVAYLTTLKKKPSAE